MVEAIKFYADWCAPCRVYGRTFSKVVNDLGVRATEINIDQDPEIASAYGVTAIPTTVILEDGKVKHKKTGALLYRDLEAMIIGE